ncbi:MAG TPA: electron transport complex subunit RsxC [Gammaproteobacteria bacterium]|nr:electron transport complex subunit RsxC [Gammaproteobacteria bacterium]
MAARFDKLFHFHGGLHLPGHKDQSTATPVVPARVPSRLILPLHQHIGQPAEALVKPGDHVLKGQLIGRAEGYVSAGVHASSSGRVVEVAERPVPHPSGLTALCVVIETDGLEQWRERDEPPTDYRTLDPSELRNRIRDAGIVGLGGAGFPTFVKMNPGAGHAIELLIINGAECEPYITCDDMLMRERPADIVTGMTILRHAVGARECVIAVEDNKPQAIAALQREVEAAGDPTVQVVTVPTRYPTGGEKQLIKVLTGREVPSQGLPADIGVVCHNVGTAAAVYRNVMDDQPLVSRFITVTGGGVAQPRNLEVLIGTPIADLVAQCGGYTDTADRLIMGGPMMGFALPDDALPVIKTTNCILVAARAELPAPRTAMPCIRCGECVQVCPANLLPQQLYWYAHAKDFDKIQDYHLFDCIECGCCAQVCPSHIPLVQYYRFAKTEIWAQERERRHADQARRRHEFRLARLERDKQEREQRLRERRKGAPQDTKKAAIQAALERSKAKKAAAGNAPDATAAAAPEPSGDAAEATPKPQSKENA